MATSETVRTSSPAAREKGAPPSAAFIAPYLAALVAMVIGALSTGAFAQLLGFSDGGMIARYGLPVARAVLDVSASLTIGLLLLAGTMIPERTSTHRRRRATRLATLTGAVWVIAGLSFMLLSVSNISGVHVSDPSFGAQVVSVMWAFDYFRVILISTMVALVVTIGSAVARSTASITWMAALGVLALLVLALIGHAAGAAAHDTAVNSIAVHVAAAAVWLGGLAALVILRPVLGEALPVVTRRFSVLAAWCYGGVGVSGVLNASLRLNGFSDLSSSYGMVLLAKVAAFVLLGLAGWRMRRRFLVRLGADPASRSAFAGFALLEIVLMGVAAGLGVALSRSAPPVPQQESADIVTSLTGYPDPGGPPRGMDWFTTFRPDWLFLAAAALACVLYIAATIRLHRRGDSWPVHRTLFWVAGWFVFLWTTCGAPGVYGKILFSAHMLMHMTLTMGIPLFLAFGAPLTLASRALPARKDKTLGPREILLKSAHSRWMNFWANPVVAGINFSGSLYLFYFSGLFELALRTHTGHIMMVVHFMLAGYVFAWALIGIDPGPKRWPPSLRLVLLFATMSFHAFFGIAIISSTELMAGDFFTQLSLPWVTDLLADQEQGGGITWGIGEFPMLALALMVAFTWMRADEHEAKRKDRQAGRDHDAELEAYNAAMRERGRMLREAESAELAHGARVEGALPRPRRRPDSGAGSGRQDGQA
ncbi:bifunctional copper resistance protein CopD/cytochrome c oxidase assembly protein [Gephyromycinifex aptenodytis]|uniref:bifunctional copper resistance protein CopD/cytochrome c oxidase assembly protein n=1 Tax=Gephyromycinifex aptenodytis TaxID=2716227 RepID=UPI001D0054FD|nr:bifunctional copper resistance protein CopD/cytochrome c oxidase assembly protein [Gephyromycinifex aptenodytis]